MKLVLILLLFCSACNTATTKTEEANSPLNEVFVYKAEDGSQYSILESSDEEMVLKTPDSQLTLKRVQSASGEKYMSPDSQFFWIKGNTFMFDPNDSTTIKGSLIKE